MQDTRSEDDPLTFSELAALSDGAALLGALMLDADRMGEAFSKGLPQAGPAQLAALSRTVETFFAAEVAELLRRPDTYADLLGYGDADLWKRTAYPLIYSVYAGGDDLFLLGPWHALLGFAGDVNRLYGRYTQNPAFSLSGGFALLRPKLPVVQISQEVQALEQVAKAANHVALREGRPTGHLALFGSIVPWAELNSLHPWVAGLATDLQTGRLSRAQVYRWLRLRGQYEITRQDDPALAMRYKPLLSYALREGSPEIFRRYSDLLNHEHPAWRFLSVWVQWGLYSLREKR